MAEVAIPRVVPATNDLIEWWHLRLLQEAAAAVASANQDRLEPDGRLAAGHTIAEANRLLTPRAPDPAAAGEFLAAELGKHPAITPLMLRKLTDPFIDESADPAARLAHARAVRDLFTGPAAEVFATTDNPHLPMAVRMLAGQAAARQHAEVVARTLTPGQPASSVQSATLSALGAMGALAAEDLYVDADPPPCAPCAVLRPRFAGDYPKSALVLPAGMTPERLGLANRMLVAVDQDRGAALANPTWLAAPEAHGALRCHYMADAIDDSAWTRGESGNPDIYAGDGAGLAEAVRAIRGLGGDPAVVFAARRPVAIAVAQHAQRLLELEGIHVGVATGGVPDDETLARMYADVLKGKNPRHRVKTLGTWFPVEPGTSGALNAFVTNVQAESPGSVPSPPTAAPTVPAALPAAAPPSTGMPTAAPAQPTNPWKMRNSTVQRPGRYRPWP